MLAELMALEKNIPAIPALITGCFGEDIPISECTYSESFVYALEKGLRPDIHRVQENADREFPGSEWHHFEMCGKMYRMYFEEVEP